MSAQEADPLSAEELNASPQAGDWLKVDATGEWSPRRGVILEVLGTGAHMHFRVRWDEQHVSLFYPAERGYIVHARTTAGGERS
jgi:hypothetical protein